MVTKNVIRGWVKFVFSEIKGDFVKEIKKSIKDKMKKELKKDWNKNWIECEIEKITHRNIDKKPKQTNIHNKQKCDALTDMREKIGKEKKNTKLVMNSV